MSLSDYDALVFKRNGFLDYEIAQFAAGKTVKGADQPAIDISSPIWKSILFSRYEWTQDKISRGWSEKEIENEIMNYYARDKKRNPWDLLKAEYKPLKRVPYLEIIRNRHQKAIESEMPGYFGKGQRREQMK